MKKIQIILLPAGVTAVLAIIALIFLGPLISFFNSIFKPGSISKTQAAANNCNGKNTICVVKSGKITSKKLTMQDITQEQQKYASEKDQHITYATNVAAAVNAIRLYTHIPNLNLSPLNNSTPIHITYYCSPDKKCWAVDNQSHQVIEGKP